MVSLSAACEAAHALGDVDAASEAYQLLRPFAHLPVMASLAVACYGSAHRPGLAAWTIGDLDLAVRHLELAVVADLALQNRPVMLGLAVSRRGGGPAGTRPRCR